MHPRAASDRLRLNAVFWVAVARLMLWLVPLPWTGRLAAAASRRPAGIPRPPVSPAAIGEAVVAASRAVPRSTCLVQAIAAGIMLRRAGLPAILRIGTTERAARPLEAHAWAECEGEVVVGGDVTAQVALARIDLARDAGWSAATSPPGRR